MNTEVNEAFANLIHSPDGAAKAIYSATRRVLIDHAKAGQPVPIWRDEKVVWVELDENGDAAREVSAP